MSENSVILSVLVPVCEAAGCGRVHNRRRWLPDEATVMRELSTEENRDGGPVDVLKAAFIRRVDHGPADTMELEEGGSLRCGHAHTYEIELWRGHVDTDDSWNTIQDTYEALADAFETDAVRLQLLALPFKSFEDADGKLRDSSRTWRTFITSIDPDVSIDSTTPGLYLISVTAGGGGDTTGTTNRPEMANIERDVAGRRDSATINAHKDVSFVIVADQGAGKPSRYLASGNTTTILWGGDDSLRISRAVLDILRGRSDSTTINGNKNTTFSITSAGPIRSIVAGNTTTFQWGGDDSLRVTKAVLDALRGQHDSSRTWRTYLRGGTKISVDSTGALYTINADTTGFNQGGRVTNLEIDMKLVRDIAAGMRDSSRTWRTFIASTDPDVTIDSTTPGLYLISVNVGGGADTTGTTNRPEMTNIENDLRLALNLASGMRDSSRTWRTYIRDATPQGTSQLDSTVGSGLYSINLNEGTLMQMFRFSFNFNTVAVADSNQALTPEGWNGFLLPVSTSYPVTFERFTIKTNYFSGTNGGSATGQFGPNITHNSDSAFFSIHFRRQTSPTKFYVMIYKNLTSIASVTTPLVSGSAVLVCSAILPDGVFDPINANTMGRLTLWIRRP